MEKTHTLEALLFAAAEPVSFNALCKALSCTPEELKTLLQTLESKLTGGIRLLTVEGAASLVTAPEASGILEEYFSIEGKDIGPAGTEVVALILYEGPCTKAHIDYVRGVNSTATIRTLMQRGLITRIQKGGQSVYHPTADLLMHLGVRDKVELPEYETITTALEQFRAATRPEDSHASSSEGTQ